MMPGLVRLIAPPGVVMPRLIYLSPTLSGFIARALAHDELAGLAGYYAFHRDISLPGEDHSLEWCPDTNAASYRSVGSKLIPELIGVKYIQLLAVPSIM